MHFVIFNKSSITSFINYYNFKYIENGRFAHPFLLLTTNFIIINLTIFKINAHLAEYCRPNHRSRTHLHFVSETITDRLDRAWHVAFGTDRYIRASSNIRVGHWWAHTLDRSPLYGKGRSRAVTPPHTHTTCVHRKIGTVVGVGGYRGVRPRPLRARRDDHLTTSLYVSLGEFTGQTRFI